MRHVVKNIFSGSTPSHLTTVYGTIITYMITNNYLYFTIFQVSVGNTLCTANSVNDTELSCVLGDSSAGEKKVRIDRERYGLSNDNVKFTYDFILSNISSTIGGVGGGYNLTIDGQGFSNESVVLICNKPCNLIYSSPTEIVCKVPKLSSDVKKKKFIKLKLIF